MFHMPRSAVRVQNVLLQYDRGRGSQEQIGPVMVNATELNGSRKEGSLRFTIEEMRNRRHIITIILAFCAIGLEIYYSICSGSCSYLQGTIFAIDLQYVGMVYMACVILLSVLKKGTLVFLFICAGVGIELYLVGFQVWYSTYCAYCLGFGAIVFFLFLLNFQKDRKVPGFIVMGLSLVVFPIFFTGSVVPTYSYSLHVDPAISVFRSEG
jgi:uncharacterized membrane protein